MSDMDARGIDFRIFRNVDSHESTFSAGSEILSPGETSRTMFIIKTGVVAVQIKNETIEELSEGNIFGEMGIVDPQPHTATVVALTDVTAYSVTEKQFLQLISTAPAFALRVMRVLARRTRAMNSRLSSGSEEGRLAGLGI
jgi:CRP-like cAMP-binding protein